MERVDLREGKVPVRREKLIIDRIVWDISLAIFLRTVVGTGSRSQDELDDWDSKLVILDRVARVKEVRGVWGGEWWAEVGEGLNWRLK